MSALPAHSAGKRTHEIRNLDRINMAAQSIAMLA
jgi:hypothetical protein